MLVSDSSLAQEQLQWKLSFTYEDSKSIPDGLSLDILGVKVGDSFEVAKEKLERLSAERGDGRAVQITETYFRIPTGGNAFLQTKYPSQLRLDMGADAITVHVSSPASGAEVFGLSRIIHIQDNTKQVEIDKFLPTLAAKYGSTPVNVNLGRKASHYLIQYDEKQATQPAYQDYQRCSASTMSYWGRKEEDVKDINRNGNCDVVIDIQFNFGISNNHARTIWYHIADLERAEATIGADYQYFRDYVESLKSGGGDAPKL